MEMLTVAAVIAAAAATGRMSCLQPTDWISAITTDGGGVLLA